MRENYQSLLEKMLRKGLLLEAFPGAVAACGVADEVYALAWCGKLSLDGPDVNRETRYDVASLTKILGPNSLALLALDAGDITLYDTLGMYFPETPRDKKDINILQLMTHTSGIEPDHRLDKVCKDPSEVLSSILTNPLLYQVGAGPHYACENYMLLGRILEKIYGSDLKTLTDEKVFQPLGMTHTGYLPQGDNIAATEVDPVSGIAWQGVVHDENARFQGGISGNAGIFSCIDDMVIYTQMLARNDGSFFSPAVMKKAIHNYTPGFDVHRGLGFHLAGTECNFIGDLFPSDSFGHTGFTGTSIAVDPHTGFFVIILSNRVHPTRDNPRMLKFRRQIHNAMYAEFSKQLAKERRSPV